MDIITTISAVVTAVLSNAQSVLAAVIALLVALVAMFLAIPGEQPEKALQSAVDFLSKFSRK
jgi:hypothetical protein